jgi:hypothetical protein
VVGMMININFTNDAVSIGTAILAWGIIGFAAFLIYKRQKIKPKLWKLLIVVIVGFFSFSINWQISDVMIRVPILPLGVWILYWVLNRQKKNWFAYRAFAWLGFCANFIFLFSTLLSIPLHHAFYPASEPSTYIALAEDESIVKIHPSAAETTLNKNKLQKQLRSMKQEKIYSEQWYYKMYEEPETINREERFPYQLIGTSSKWGSGYHSIIYIEDDGKGLLIQTSKNQLYFRLIESILEEGE